MIGESEHQAKLELLLVKQIFCHQSLTKGIADLYHRYEAQSLQFKEMTVGYLLNLLSHQIVEVILHSQ